MPRYVYIYLIMFKILVGGVGVLNGCPLQSRFRLFFLASLAFFF